jgi:hypothetical protein
MLTITESTLRQSTTDNKLSLLIINQWIKLAELSNDNNKLFNRRQQALIQSLTSIDDIQLANCARQLIDRIVTHNSQLLSTNNKILLFISYHRLRQESIEVLSIILESTNNIIITIGTYQCLHNSNSGFRVNSRNWNYANTGIYVILQTRMQFVIVM